MFEEDEMTSKPAKSTVTRRQMLILMGATGATAALAACAGATPTAAPTTVPATTAPEPTAAPTEAAAAEATAVPTEAAAEATTAPTEAAAAGGVTNSVGKALPADAAAPEQQVYLLSGGGNPGTDAQITGSVYNRSGLADLYAVPLTRINHDFELIPGAATEWSVSEDGLKWTFKLRNDLAWSDGSGNANADDFIATMRHMADPKTAYDFTWYWDTGNGNIKNLGDVIAGSKPVEEVGISKEDDYTLIMETSQPTPYLPRLGIYFMPFNAKALAANGPQYLADPTKTISCGPFLIKTWEPTRFEAVANGSTAEDIRPYLERVVATPYPNPFQAYQAGQVDHVGVANAADIETVLNSPELSKDATPDVGDFRTDYFFFDVTKKPYDNIKFREALAHLLDRDSIVEFITKPLLARPAYSFLAPGFPAANGEALKDIQKYDPELAKQLYAESGETPAKLTLTYRDDYAFYEAMSAAYADQIKQHLGIEVEIRKLPVKDFSDALLAKPTQIEFGAISYGMDYLDPSNMLGVFKGTDQGGRHNWNDKQYQDLIAQAGPMTDIEARTKVYQDAEKVMTESFAFVWIVHRTPVNLWKPYLKGEGFQPGKVNTNPGWAWPANSGFTPYFETMYIGNNVPERNIP
jgi:ABC-type oligopeptide transport system substrate-binding subunit